MAIKVDCMGLQYVNVRFSNSLQVNLKIVINNANYTNI